MSVNECPGTATLEAFLLGRLDEKQAAPLEEHLLTCPHCTTQAKTVASHDTLIDAMCNYRPRRPEDAEAVDRIVDRLRSVAESSASVAVVDIDRAGSESEQAADGKGLFGRLARVVGSEPEDDSSGTHHADLYDFLEPAESEDELGRLGQYRVMKLIGAGGMGVVFMAEDPTLKRKVAIKAMHPALAASAGARERFMREAQATAAIEHDHIVTIYQVDKDRGIPYLAMPLLRGETLDERLDRRPKQSVAETLRIGREIAAGLAAAQKQGLIHRDIKPANIWLEETTGRVKILDFGLARSADKDSTLTQAGAIVGTPQYMSPEQAAKTDVDHRSDLFSLGCVLYRMSTGAPPFIGPDHTAILDAVAGFDPPAPSTLRPEMPAELAALIMQLLSKERDARLESAASVVNAIERIEASLQHAEPPAADSVPQTSTETTPLTQTRSSRGPSRVALAAIVLAMLVPLSYYAYTIIVSLTHGQLIIEADDQQVEVTIKQAGQEALIEIVDRRTMRRIYLRPGEYKLDVTIRSGEDETRFTTDEFSLERGDKEIVNVRRELAKHNTRSPSSPPAVAQAPDPIPHSVEPQSLADWLKDRDVITVAQDGSGDYETIQKALDNLKEGQVVKVLDKGPYRERLSKLLPIDVGLVTDVGTRIELPKWERRVKSDRTEGKWYYWGPYLRCTNGLRLSGFEFTAPKSPEDTEVSTLLTVKPAGQVVIERCRILHEPRYTFDEPETDVLKARARSALVSWPAVDPSSTTVHLIENYLEGSLEVFDSGSIVIERNAILGWRWAGVNIKNKSGRNVLRHNILVGNHGVTLFTYSKQQQAGKPRPSFVIENNSIVCSDAPVFLLSLASKEEDRLPPPTELRIQNNIAYSKVAVGLLTYPEYADADNESWQLGHNSFSAEPLSVNPELQAMPQQMGDVILSEPFISKRAEAADFLRISSDGPLANAGLGDGRPNYLGALAPGPAPVEGDWFTRILFAGDEVRRFSGHQGWVNAVDLSPDGKLAVTAGSDSSVRLWDVATGKELYRLDGHEEIVWSVALSPDGKYIASGGGGQSGQDGRWTSGADNDIRLWDVQSRKEIRRFKGHTGFAYRLTFSPDGTRLLSGGGYADPTVRLWDVVTGEQIYKLEGHTAWVASVAFSPNGRRAASSGEDNTIRIWDLESAEQVGLIDGHTDCVSGVRFHPRLDQVLSCSKDGTVRLWDIGSSAEIRQFAGHQGFANSVEFSPTGRFALSSGQDGTVLVWDVEQGGQAVRIDAHSAPIWCAAFSTDGHTVLSGSADGTARLWRLPNVAAAARKGLPSTSDQ